MAAKQIATRSIRAMGPSTIIRQVWVLVVLVAGLGLAHAENVVYPPGTIRDVTAAPYHADRTGSTDATAALQRAIDDNVDRNRALYVPNGTYLISDELSFGDNGKRLTIQGQSRDGTVIRIADNAAAFQDSDSRRGAFYTGRSPAQRFGNYLRDLSIHTGNSNPGAVGIRFNTSNFGGLSNLRIVDGAPTSSNGTSLCGIDMFHTDEIGPLYGHDIEIVGFDFGIRTAAHLNSSTWEHLTLSGQRQFGIFNDSNIMTIRGLESTNGVPAVRNKGGSAYFALIDAKLAGTGAASGLPAVDNDKTLFARNISTTGYATAIANTGGTGAGAVGPQIDEFVSHPTLRLFDDSRLASLDLPIHDPPVIPWEQNFANWANPLGFGAAGDGKTDDTAAMQAAIDSGATTIVLPGANHFVIDGELLVRGKVERITGTFGFLKGGGTIRFVEGSSPAVILERCRLDHGDLKIIHDTTRTVVLESVVFKKIDSRGSGDFFINDAAGAPIRFLQPGQRVWCRQLNPELRGAIDVLNNGADLVVLGLKTERGGVKIHTRNAGRTEVIGGHIYSTSSSEVKPGPIFSIENASASFAAVRESNFGAPKFQMAVREDRGPDQRTLLRSEAPGGFNGIGLPLYSGHVDAGSEETITLPTSSSLR